MILVEVVRCVSVMDYITLIWVQCQGQHRAHNDVT